MSRENNFDNFIKSKLEQEVFAVPPGAWDAAQNMMAAQEKKRRAGILWWSIPALLLLIGAGGWWYWQAQPNTSELAVYAPIPEQGAKLGADEEKKDDTEKQEPRKNSADKSTQKNEKVTQQPESNINPKSGFAQKGQQNNASVEFGSEMTNSSPSNGASVGSEKIASGSVSATVDFEPASEDANSTGGSESSFNASGEKVNFTADLGPKSEDDPKGEDAITDAEPPPANINFRDIFYEPTDILYFNGFERDVQSPEEKSFSPLDTANTTVPLWSQFGIFAGASVVTPITGDENVESSGGRGFTAGLRWSTRIHKQLELNLNLGYSQRRGLGVSGITERTEYSFDVRRQQTTIRPISLHYLEVPLYISYQAGVHRLSVGGYGAYLMGSRSSVELSEANSYGEYFSQSSREWGYMRGLRSWDYGAMLEYQYQWNERLRFGWRGIFGAADLLERDYFGLTGRNRNYQFRIQVDYTLF